MGAWKNLSVAKRMLLVLGIQALFFGVAGLWTFDVARSTARTVEGLQNREFVLSETAHAMRFQVTNTWQWLSDISATRGRDRLDDGFDRAREQVDGFLANLETLRKLYAGEPETLETLARIERDMRRFHEAGVRMAQAYIRGGADEGNRLMGGFDEAAERLQDVLEPFIERQVVGTRQTIEGTVARLDRFEGQIQVLCGVALLALLATGILLTRSITRPLARQLGVVEAVAKGDLTVAVAVDRGDEFGRLAEGFRQMVQSLQSTVGGVVDMSGALATAADEMSAATQQISASTEEINAQARAMAGAATEMSTSVQDISANTQHVSQSAGRVDEAAASGAAVVEQTAGSLTRIQEVVNAVGDTIRQLGERSDRIGAVVEVIEDIADQTNLLALNAAIEAARAGEHGRGFSVVADEVRSLAEKTVRATREIGETVRAIQAEAAQAVTATATSVEAVREGTRLGAQTAAAMEAIGGESRTASQQAEAIAAATEQLAAAIVGVAENADQVSRGIQQDSVAAQQLSRTAADLAGKSAELRRLTERFRV